MTRYFKPYRLFLIQHFKTLMAYRASFLLGAISHLVLQAARLATVWVIMRQVPSLNDWSYDEVLLVYGFVTLAKSVNPMFADNLWTVGRVYIRAGAFDRFLVRPIAPLYHLLADRFCQAGVGDFLVGLALVIKSSLALGIAWTPLNLLILVVGVLSGGFIFIALNLITCVSSFWIVDSVPVTRLIFDNHLFGQYPLTIYPTGINILLTWSMPYGFASFYPASYLLDREVGNIAWFGPCFAAFLLYIGYRIWQFGLRHYSSTGS